ncbi:hypothetical protein [Pseudodesulfovibrio portus]|uniref:Uncharacterized protein n=1 Tax=Pseudodesulfovibrio portus TaxID=231439 RepID=A0ABM8ANR9_9BACT|nr:hypothetical protein [Pseudodesulfovibrio portus]BDQ33036.1 hypothetical protein JCM14722_05780 [Pseudodesulfovibrio portus]
MSADRINELHQEIEDLQRHAGRLEEETKSSINELALLGLLISLGTIGITGGASLILAIGLAWYMFDYRKKYKKNKETLNLVYKEIRMIKEEIAELS